MPVGTSRYRFSERPVDLTKPAVVIGEPEFDDVHGDQFGLPVSDLYRPYEPPFEKSQQEARAALARLRKKHGVEPIAEQPR